MEAKLLEAFLDGRIPQDDYQPANADYTRQTSDLEREDQIRKNGGRQSTGRQ